MITRRVMLFAALTNFASGAALADHMKFDGVPLTGSPKGGFHVLDLDGVKCKLKSSSIVSGASAGCNYIITIPGIGAEGLDKGPIVIKPEQDNGCSTQCEP